MRERGFERRIEGGCVGQQYVDRDRLWSRRRNALQSLRQRIAQSGNSTERAQRWLVYSQQNGLRLPRLGLVKPEHPIVSITIDLRGERRPGGYQRNGQSHRQ